MILKISGIINLIGFAACLPVVPLSLFFWEDAGNPIVLLILIAIYCCPFLNVWSIIYSLKNLRTHINEISSIKKIVIYLSIFISLVPIYVLFDVL